MGHGVLRQVNRSGGGLPKLPLPGPITVNAEGVEGDWQLNRRYHGGPFKAVLMIANEVIEDLASRGYPVYPGALGENFTVSGIDPANWRRGQQYRVGEDLVIELTTLRQPCNTLYPLGRNIGKELYDARCKAGDFTSPHWAKGGFYARVVHPGIVSEGARIELLSDIA
jgi:MOSC domain-containing protein YiiM